MNTPSSKVLPIFQILKSYLNIQWSTLDFLLTISNFATIYHLTLIISRLCAQYLLTLYFDALISEKRRFCSVLCVLKKLCLDTVQAV